MMVFGWPERSAGLTGARRFRLGRGGTVVLQVEERRERTRSIVPPGVGDERAWVADGTRWRDARIEDLTEHEAAAA